MSKWFVLWQESCYDELDDCGTTGSVIAETEDEAVDLFGKSMEKDERENYTEEDFDEEEFENFKQRLEDGWFTAFKLPDSDEGFITKKSLEEEN